MNHSSSRCIRSSVSDVVWMSISLAFPVTGLQPSTDTPQGLLQSELWRLCDQQSHSALCQSLFGGSPGGLTLAESTQESEQFRDSLMLPAVYEHLGSIPRTQPLQAPGFSRYAAVHSVIECKLALFLFSPITVACVIGLIFYCFNTGLCCFVDF